MIVHMFDFNMKAFPLDDLVFLDYRRWRRYDPLE